MSNFEFTPKLPQQQQQSSSRVWKRSSICIWSSVVCYSTPTIVIQAKRGAGFRGDIAIDDIRYFSSETCTVTLSPVMAGTGAATATTSPAAASLPTSIPVNTTTCDFEESNICTWLNDVGDDFDWTFWHGSTPSSNTGPAHDFTFGNSSGHYLYAEASSPRQQGDIARLVSTLIPPSQHAACFNFMYSMYGEDTGTLNLYVRVGPVTTLVWTLSGDQGTDWLPGSFPLPSTSGTQHSQIIIESVTGKGFRGDIALDDLKFSTISCIVSPVKAGTGATTATSSPAAASLPTAIPVNTTTNISCSFSVDSCGWKQDTNDDYDWLRNKGQTASPQTGPDGDHTGGGYYMYIETSNSRYGEKATLYSPQFRIPQGQTKCFSFWYYMYGAEVNTLEVLKSAGINQQQIWIQQGNKGAQWLLGQLQLTSLDPIALYIRGTTGIGYLGDIAIDDISLTNGTCTGS